MTDGGYAERAPDGLQVGDRIVFIAAPGGDAMMLSALSGRATGARACNQR